MLPTVLQISAYHGQVQEGEKELATTELNSFLSNNFFDGQKQYARFTLG